MNNFKWFLIKLIVKDSPVVMNVEIDSNAIKKGWLLHGESKTLIKTLETMKSGILLD